MRRRRLSENIQRISKAIWMILCAGNWPGYQGIAFTSIRESYGKSERATAEKMSVGMR